MARWTTITADHLKAAGHGDIMSRASAIAAGAVEPVADAIENAVAAVRLAVMAGNALDADPEKVPLSLKGLTVRMAVFALMGRIRLKLGDDQQKQAERDEQQLLRIEQRKVRVEPPDDPETTDLVAPQNRGTWNSENKLLGRTHPAPRPAAQRSGDGRYANPEGPEDSGA